MWVGFSIIIGAGLIGLGIAVGLASISIAIRYHIDESLKTSKQLMESARQIAAGSSPAHIPQKNNFS